MKTYKDLNMSQKKMFDSFEHYWELVDMNRTDFVMTIAVLLNKWKLRIKKS